MRRQYLVSLAVITLVGVFNPVVGVNAQDEDWSGYPATEWPLAGGHFGQTRHSTLDQITPDNLERLGGAWVTELDGGEVTRSTAVVQDGLLFLSTGLGHRAFDASLGRDARDRPLVPDVEPPARRLRVRRRPLERRDQHRHRLLSRRLHLSRLLHPLLNR